LSYVPPKSRTLATSTELHGTFKRRAFTALSAMVVLGGVQITTGLTPASAGPPPSLPTTTITTVGQTAYLVPAGVSELTVTVVGAQGGGQHGAIAPGTAGQGATVQAIIPATAGTTLYAEVGSSAGAGGGGATGPAANGGGESALQSCSVGAGGCAYTAIPGTDPRLVAAGGGGGGGEGGVGSTGPAGGDAAGAVGPGAGGNGTQSSPPTNAGGHGGLTTTNTTAAIGTASAACSAARNGLVGSPGQGGTGGWVDGNESGGGGGGGGWVGGSGGGAGDCPFEGSSGTGGGGGAGASFAEASALNVSIALAGGTTPEVVITPFVPRPSTVSVSTSNVSAVWGQSVTLTATVTGSGTFNPSGAVKFKANGADIAGCTAQPVGGTSNPTTATCTTTALPIGHPDSITAFYLGDGTNAPSDNTASPFSQFINRAASSASLSVDVNPSVSGQAVTYSATESAVAPGSGTPTGSVTFSSDGTTVGDCTQGAEPIALVGGVANCTTHSGTAVGSPHSVTVSYPGDAHFIGNTSPIVSEFVAQAATTTVLTSGVDPTEYLQPTTLTATVGATSPGSGTPTGTASFTDNGSTIDSCDLQALGAGVATCSVSDFAVGTHTPVIAHYSGDDNYLAGDSNAVTQVVTKGSVSPVADNGASPTTANPGENVEIQANFYRTLDGSCCTTDLGGGTYDFQFSADSGATWTDIPGCSATDKSYTFTAFTLCDTTSLPSGSIGLRVVYSGDADFNSATWTDATNEVIRFASSTSVTSSAASSVFGNPVTFTAKVTSAGAGTPTGGVEFDSDGTPITDCTQGAEPIALNGSAQAQCTTSSLTAGSHTITVSYGGDGAFAASNGALPTQIVNQGASQVAVSSSINPTTFGQSTTFTAHVSAVSPAIGTPTGSLDFVYNDVEVPGCTQQTLDGSGNASCSTAGLPAGVDDVTAVYAGDTNFKPSVSGAVTQLVGTDSTTAAISSSQNPSVTGQAVTFTATVTAHAPGSGTPTGSVTFLDQTTSTDLTCAEGAQPIALDDTATALCTSTFAAVRVGDHIIAMYLGDANFQASNSAPVVQVVGKAATATSVTADNNPAVVGQPVAFTATVSVTDPGAAIAGNPTGTVKFQSQGVDISGCGSIAIDGSLQAVCNTSFAAADTYSITVLFTDGDGNYANSDNTGSPLAQVVDIATTTTVNNSNENPSTYGDTVTYTATVTSNTPGSGTPTGFVDFTSDGVDISGCSAAALDGSGTALCATATLGAGSDTIVANYLSDDNYSASNSDDLIQTVAKADPGITLSAGPDTVTGEATNIPVTLSAAGGGLTPTGTASFLSDGAAISDCTALALTAGSVSCATTTLTPGGYTIEAGYSGDDNYNAISSLDVTQTVGKAETTTVVTSTHNPSVSGQTITYTATISITSPGDAIPAGLTGAVHFTDNGSDISPACTSSSISAQVATCTVVHTGIGIETINAFYSGDGNYLSSDTTGSPLTQTINQDGTTTVVTANADPSVVGQDVTYTASVSAGTPGSGTPTGDVNFFDGANPISGCSSVALNGSGQATCDAGAYAAPSTHSITADYLGDVNFVSSNSATFTQNVSQASSTTAVTSSANPSVFGQGVTFTATVSAQLPGLGTPTGSVQFVVDSIDLGSPVALNGSDQATSVSISSLAVGTLHTVHGVYSGDTNFVASSGAVIGGQTVTKASSSTALTSSVNPSIFGQSTTLVATVTATAPGAGTPSGTVTFKDGSVAVTGCTNPATLNGSGVASCATTGLSTGTRSITAVYAGDGNFTTSISSIVSQVVGLSRGTYVAVTPYRVFDSRSGDCVQCHGSFGPASHQNVQITGTINGGTVPSNAIAVVVNLTAVSGSQPTFLQLTPTGIGTPGATSNLNVPAGITQATLVTVQLSASGQVTVFNAAGTVDAVMDVSGYFLPATGPSIGGPGGTAGTFHPLAPNRICDTRANEGTACDASTSADNPLGPAASRIIHVVGNRPGQSTSVGHVPSDGTAAAVVLNLTGVQGTSSTNLTVYPTTAGSCGTPPHSSNLNIYAHTALPTRVIVPVDASGNICVFNALGSINLVIDVNGWFGTGGETTAGALFYPTAPVRICDTRASQTANQCTGKTISANGTLTLSALVGAPSSPVALVSNLTGVGGTQATVLAMFPAGPRPSPTTSDLNPQAHDAIANLVIVQIGAGGNVDVYNSVGTINVVLDVQGWFAP
jgi:large repetitive protein